MPQALPANPSVRFLKEQAKDLLKAQRAGDVSCCKVLRQLRRFTDTHDEEILDAKVGLQEAQFALALHYGFASWEHLIRAVAVRDHMIERIDNWDRLGGAEGFAGNTEGKAHQLLTDPEWLALEEIEQQLEPLSEPCKKIRRQIANLERSHESYFHNIEQLLDMISTMTPGKIRDCGGASPERRTTANAWADALDAWRGESIDADDHRVQEAAQRLGKPSEEKLARVQCLTACVRGQDVTWDDVSNDTNTIECRIKHFEICHCEWDRNLGLLLNEIGAGKQLVPWHTPDGFSTCGGCPQDRIERILPFLKDVLGWLNGTADAGNRAARLGEQTPEKHWLVGCLCKQMTAQHRDRDENHVLPAVEMKATTR